MLGKTHLTVGIATGIAIAEPSTLSALVLTMGAGAIGGLIPDMDVDTTDAHEGATFVTIAALIVAALVVVLDNVFHFHILGMLMSDTNRWRTILALIGFVAVCAIGKGTKHRTFMHSILAACILTGLIGIILPSAVLGFTGGILSHLIIDFFNRKGEQLLFPLKKRFCLKLCDSDGIFNSVLFFAGILATVLLMVKTLM